MDDKETIRLLNEAFVHEIDNSLTYVRNSFMMRECDPSRVTEAIAVDEMRHMWWLAELITKRGGEPAMEHRKLDFGGQDLKSQLERQIVLETEAIDIYKHIIEVAGDPEVIGVAKHILDEERRHRREFKERLARI